MTFKRFMSLTAMVRVGRSIVEVAEINALLAGLPLDRITDPRLSLRRCKSYQPSSLVTSEVTHPDWTQQHEEAHANAAQVPPYIYREIGGTDRWIWFVLGNLLALAAVCPFVGSISDMIGRRYVAILGACFLILGMIVSSTAHTMNIFICMLPSVCITLVGSSTNGVKQAAWYSQVSVPVSMNSLL